MIMLTKAERIRKVIRLCEAIEKSVDTLLLEQAKEWLKRFIGEPWYEQAIQAYVEIAREAGGIFADHRQKVLEAIGREELFQELTDPNVNMGAAVTPVNTTTAAAIVPVSSGGKKGKKTKARSVKSYKTWEYLDAWYNHVVVDDVRDTLLELEQEFQNKLEEFYQKKVADKLIPEASKGILEQLGMEFDFNKYDEATRDYLKDKKIHWAKQVAEETEKDIKAQLVKGYEAGLSSYEIADNIKQSTGFSMSRAEKIARTEVMSSCNYAQYAASEANPDIVGHYWRSQNSRRTRATHRAASKQYRPIGEPFDIGGAKLMFPGDGSLGAPAKEIVNCRCWLEMVFRDEVENDVIEMLHIDGGIEESDTDIKKYIEQEWNRIPASHQEIVKQYVKSIHVVSSGSSKFNPYTREIIINKQARKGDLVHEIGHSIEYALDLFRNDDFLAVLNHDLSYDLNDINSLEYIWFKEDGSEVIVERDTLDISKSKFSKFISEYQARLYDTDINNEPLYIAGEKQLNNKCLREYFSEGYREFVDNPRNIEEKDKLLFDFINELAKKGENGG